MTAARWPPEVSIAVDDVDAAYADAQVRPRDGHGREGQGQDVVASDACALEAVKERARREDRTAGEVLSDLARTALTRREGGRHTAKNGFTVLASRGRTVTNSLVERLRDEDGS